MDFFSENAKKVLLKAENFAKEIGHNNVNSIHILFALSAVPKSTSKFLMMEAGLNSIKIRNAIEKLILSEKPNENLDLSKKSQSDIFSSKKEAEMSEEAKEILISSSRLAMKLKSQEISTAHLLSAILMDSSFASEKILSQFETEKNKILKNLEDIFAFSKQKNFDENIKKKSAINNIDSKFKALRYFTTDLTLLASEGNLDPVVGREREIDRLITILGRRTKNNPILVGDPGVGKTAIVEGLAQRIAKNDVPLILAGKRILALDLTLMISGTKYRGEFEERIKNIINETILAQNVILFIDEIHTIVGAGSTEGSLDAANILKPALARGALKLIGATTFDEFNKKIEKDPALERRFQKVQVDENSIDETKEILLTLRPNYEAHHKVSITDEAIKIATELSARYINDRQLPDKAIDLLDESASRVSSKESVIPKELKEIEEKIREVVNKKNQFAEADNFELASKMRTEELKLIALHKEIFEKTFAKEKESWPIVDEIAISETLSEATGIPIERLLKQKTSSRKISLFEKLKKHIIGQDKALEIVSKSISRAEAKLSDPNRPIGSFIFVGPTGVGKTELAKALATEVYNQENSLIRFDMSEFSEKFNASKLIGSPAGYVGFEDGGNLTEKVRKKPYSVVLFDEIEKAHPDIFNLLLQILDEGFLMDAKGRKINFKNTIIILTSNIGTEFFTGNELGFEGKKSQNFDEAENKISKSISETFRPEFLNRIDKIVFFRPLDKNSLQKITKKMLSPLISNLEKQKINLKISDEVIDFILSKSDTEKMGARPVRRIIETEITDKISELLETNDLEENGEIEFFVENSSLLFKIKSRTKEPVLS
ncbi:MAG: ATP-dependent Clp protease ATP-binding subunit [Patescibacteria group bacterium]